MKEVVIYGCGSTRIQFPGKNGMDLWSVNNGFRYFDEPQWQEVDKVFIVDKITEAEFDFSSLKKLSCIVAPMLYPEFSNIEVYPIEEVLAKFRTRFFSNAICYMIAYALLYGYEKIWFYGIDMMTTSCYVIEKGGVEYWMGIAHAMGVPVMNTRESATGKTIDGRMYGYWGMNGEKGHIEALAGDVRRLIDTLPNMVDESEEWVKQDGNWVRQPQKIRKLVKEYR